MEKTKRRNVGGDSDVTTTLYRSLVNKALVIKTMVSIKDFLLADSPSIRVHVNEDGIHLSEADHKDIAVMCALVEASPENFNLRLTADNYGSVVLYYHGSEEQELSIWQSLEFALTAFKSIRTSIVSISQGDSTKDDASRVINQLLDITYN